MFQVSSTVRRTKTEDGGVLLDIHHGRMFCLNVVGSQIIDLLERGFDAAQIAREVSDAYATDIEKVGADVREFIEVLNKHHILQVRAAGLTAEPVSPA
ncbi:MAG: PqqD family protein [Candidatus Acidiferrales bacterium]